LTGEKQIMKVETSQGTKMFKGVTRREPLFEPVPILASYSVMINEEQMNHWLIHWKEKTTKEAT